MENKILFNSNEFVLKAKDQLFKEEFLFFKTFAIIC